MTQADKDKFLAMLDLYRVITVDGHWLWIGSKNAKGYGQISSVDQKTSYKVHRLLLIIQGKLDPESDMLALHKCDRKDCFNPEHLYVGTASDNQLDAVAAGTHYSTKTTHCPRGHEYTEENIYRHRGKRNCRACRHIVALKHKNNTKKAI